MAEFVVIYDSAAGSFISKQLGSAHLADGAVVSGKLGAGSVISGAIAAASIGDPHIRSGVLDAAKLTGTLQDQRLPTAQSGKGFTGLTDFINDDVGEPTAVRFKRTNFGSGQLAVEFHSRYVDEWLGRIAFFGSGDTLAYDFIGHDQATLATQFVVLYSRLPTQGDAMHFGRAGDLQLYMSGNVILPGRVDSVDISAHTHGAGAGDAPNILSASIASGILGPHLASGGILSAHISSGLIGWPFLRNEGVLSAAIASGIIGGPLLQNWGLVSGKVASGAIQPDNISFLAGMISRPTPYGCVLDLDFAEGLGTKAYDKSGNNNDGDLVAGPTWTDDALMGRCLSFDGVDDYVEAPILTPDYVTVEAWINMTSVITDYPRVVSNLKQESGTWKGFEIYQYLDTRDIRIQINVGGVFYSIALGTPDLGTWAHVAFTMDGTFIRPYFNGVATSPTAAAGTTTYHSSPEKTYIGKNPNIGTDFNGLIAEVRIYNRALSADAIRGRYIHGLTKLGKVQGSVRLFTSGWGQKMWFDPETADIQAVSGAVRTSGLLYAGTSQIQLTGTDGRILSGAILSGILGPHLASGGILSAHISSGLIGWPFLRNEGILSAAIAANVLATPHFVNQGILSASLAAGAIGGAHLNANDVWPGRTFSGSITLNLPYVTSVIKIDKGGVHQDFMQVTGMPAGEPATLLVNGGEGLRIYDTALANLLTAASGQVLVHNRVDSVDISAHTHGAGAGDAPNILSASIASGILGPHLASGGILSAHISSGLIGWPFLRNEGILSAAIAANVLATPHFANQGILSASIGARAVGTPHFAYGSVPEYISSFIITGSGDYTVAVPSGFLTLKIQGRLILMSGSTGGVRMKMRFGAYSSGDYYTEIYGNGFTQTGQAASGLDIVANYPPLSGYTQHVPFDGSIAVPVLSGVTTVNMAWTADSDQYGPLRGGGRFRLNTSGLPSVLSSVTIHSAYEGFSGSILSLWGIRPSDG